MNFKVSSPIPVVLVASTPETVTIPHCDLVTHDNHNVNFISNSVLSDALSVANQQTLTQSLCETRRVKDYLHLRWKVPTD